MMVLGFLVVVLICFQTSVLILNCRTVNFSISNDFSCLSLYCDFEAFQSKIGAFMKRTCKLMLLSITQPSVRFLVASKVDNLVQLKRDRDTMALQLVDKPLFAKIKNSWTNQCEKYDEEIENYASNSMDHAKRIVEEGSAGQDYSIFCAEVDNDFACILHVNRAKLPGTTGVTQKVMWVLLAPKYDFETISAEDVAQVAFAVVSGAIDLCKEEGRSQHVKIHVGNMGDREFFAGIAFGLKSNGNLSDVEIRGNWLHMSIA